MKKIIGLRVDVDFEIGLTNGVPFLLDFFNRHEIKGTFYVTMGPDGFLRHKARLKERGYLRRVAAMNPARMISGFGIPYIFKQLAGRAGDVGGGHPAVMRRILSEGHELGVHGHDHFWWAESVWNCEDNEIKKEMQMGLESFKKNSGVDAEVWASPNWRCSVASLRLVDSYGFLYGADCRGKTPFFPVSGSWRAKTIQLPITLPCLHEIKGYLRKSDTDSVLREFASNLSDTFNIWCIHDYYEGILERRMFSDIATELLAKGYRFAPVKELLNFIDVKNAPLCKVGKKVLSGGRGEVSCQDTGD